MSFQEEYRELMAKPIDAIKPDIFFRPDNFRDEPWYDDFQMYMAIGVCQPQEEHVLPIRKALKVMGLPTHSASRDGKMFVLPGEARQSEHQPNTKNHHDRER